MSARAGASRDGLVPLVGREDERAVVDEWLQALAAGRGGALLIQGEAGIGKSRLVAETLALEEARGVRIASAVAQEHEHERPFAAVAAALGLKADAADPQRARIGAMLRGEAVPGPSGLPGLGYSLIDAIVSLVARESAEVPMVLAVDDLQWADRSSLAVLQSVLHANPRRVLVLGMRRLYPVSAEMESLVATAESCGVLLDLGPLDRDAMAKFAQALLDARIGTSLIQQLSRAGGNPLFAAELIHTLEREGALHLRGGVVEAADTPLPPTVRMAILRRLRPLDPHTLHVVRMAALLGSRFSVADLAVVVDREPTSLLPQLAEAIRAGILADVGEVMGFRHDVVREAVRDELGISTRRALHLQAGRRLARGGASASLVASHLAAGAVPGDREAVEWLRRAAEEAASRAPAIASDLLERALRLCPLDTPTRDHLLAELVRSLLWSGQLEQAEQRARTLLDRSHDLVAGALARSFLARILVYRGHVRSSIAEVQAALATPSLPEPVQARLLADLSLRLGWVGALDELDATARRAIDVGERSGDDVAVSTARSARAWRAALHGDVGEAVSQGERALAAPRGSGEAVQPVQARLYYGFALISADRFADARRVLLEALELSAQLGTRWAGPLAHAFLALERYCGGAWDDALADADTAVTLASETGTRIWDPLAYAVRAAIAAHRGEDQGAAAALAAADVELGGMDPVHFARTRLLAARALLEEARGQAPRAYATLRAGWEAAETFGALADLADLGPRLVRHAMAAGDAPYAADAAARVKEIAARSRTAASQAAASLCRAALTEDPGPALQAVQLLRGTPRVLDRALACEEALGLAAATGRRGERAELAAEALGLYESLGASWDLARLRARLRGFGVRLGARRPRAHAQTGWESLTERERRVVDLAAEGMSNPAIATRLFLSRRTVESHVSRALAKLGLASRVELAAAAARRNASSRS
jgi:DNA-binding CsgD family transcriptional regulator